MSNLVSVIITTHGQSEDLPIILGSLARQKIYGPGKNSVNGTDFLYDCKGKCDLPIDVVVTSDGSFAYDPVRGFAAKHIDKVVECPKGEAPGHHTREPGIMAAKGDYVVLTNQDNYFTLGWRHRIESAFNKSTGMVYWNCINNLWKWTDFGGSRIKRGHIDLSCVAVKTEIARVVGFEWRNYDADFDYIDSCAQVCKQKGFTLNHINEALCVHN